ncbi:MULTISPECIES: HAD family phosphatase [Paenibacillus]|uniref:HAD family hydrolase n=1 Tax=Paenibacillus TaxID=44249 RepID=UPI002FE428E5
MVKGVIFDMDNTLLRSRIDFEAMKQDVYQFLVSHGILPDGFDLNRHTASTLIEAAVKTNRMNESLMKDLWDVPKKHELIGMKDAELEPGVKELLNEWQGLYHLVVVTNNSLEAAEAALRDHDVLRFFDQVVGREQVRLLKPAPDAFLHVLRHYGGLSPGAWISVGDSWIDGKASALAGIPFIAYCGDEAKMKEMEVFPRAFIRDLRDLNGYL